MYKHAYDGLMAGWGSGAPTGLRPSARNRVAWRAVTQRRLVPPAGGGMACGPALA